MSGLPLDKGALNLEGLRSLELVGIPQVETLEGLGNLRRLTYFSWETATGEYPTVPSALILGQLPLSLKQLEIFVPLVLFASDLLARCCNLFTLRLWSVKASSLDLSSCWSLESVLLSNIKKLQT